MVIQNRQRPHLPRPSSRPLEIHLPEFIGAAALETLRGRRIAPLFANQTVAPQDAMDGVTRQRQSRLCQKYLQLARTPVGIALAQLQHLLLPRRTRTPRTLVWSTALLGDARHSCRSVALQPQIPGGPRDPVRRT